MGAPDHAACDRRGRPGPHDRTAAIAPAGLECQRQCADRLLCRLARHGPWTRRHGDRLAAAGGAASRRAAPLSARERAAGEARHGGLGRHDLRGRSHRDGERPAGCAAPRRRRRRPSAARVAGLHPAGPGHGVPAHDRDPGLVRRALFRADSGARCHRQGDPAVAALRRLALGFALLFAAPASANSQEIDPVARWHAEIADASVRFGVPVAWIERVMRAESGGMTMLDGRPITSRAGAIGLMQLMPATWAAMRATYGLGGNPHDPHDNILAGTAYLRAMYDRFGYPGLFGAYNAGPGRYAAYLATGRPLPGETRAYLATLSGTGPQDMRPTPSASRGSPPPLFVVLSTAANSSDQSPSRAPDASPNPLFAVRARR
ncbi:lytic transglycosylase domain-containing protein [Sphingobium sp. LMA1-1-1.1]